MKNSIILFTLLTFLSIASCKKEDNENNNSSNNTTTNPATPSDTVTSFMIYFEDTKDSITDVVSYDDPDGAGPKQANFGGAILKPNRLYKLTFRIEDGTNKSNVVILNNKLKTNGKDYKLCFTNTIGLNATPTDTDGSLPIGLTYDLTTQNASSGNFTFTIKYQKGNKNGDCAPGIVYHTCTIPAVVN